MGAGILRFVQTYLWEPARAGIMQPPSSLASSPRVSSRSTRVRLHPLSSPLARSRARVRRPSARLNLCAAPLISSLPFTSVGAPRSLCCCSLVAFFPNQQISTASPPQTLTDTRTHLHTVLYFLVHSNVWLKKFAIRIVIYCIQIRVCRKFRKDERILEANWGNYSSEYFFLFRICRGIILCAVSEYSREQQESMYTSVLYIDFVSLFFEYTISSVSSKFEFIAHSESVYTRAVHNTAREPNLALWTKILGSLRSVKKFNSIWFFW